MDDILNFLQIFSDIKYFYLTGKKLMTVQQKRLFFDTFCTLAVLNVPAFS